MESIDHIVINFDQSQILLLNICLGILMFGVALDLKWSDFSYVFNNSKSVLTGLVSQWLLLPLLTMILIWIIKPHVSLALGMILIAGCPGGNVSNYAVHLAKANAALSVILTMISTVLCALSTPFIFNTLQNFLPNENMDLAHFHIQFSAMVWTIIQLILLPLLIGALFVKYLPAFTQKIKSFIKKLSLFIFIGFVVVALLGNLENLKEYVGQIFILVMVHNGMALLIGYLFSKYLLKLPEKDSRAISIETGIQNSGLALILIFNFFNGLGGMALIAAWWSIWHLISSLGIAFYWRERPVN